MGVAAAIAWDGVANGAGVVVAALRRRKLLHDALASLQPANRTALLSLGQALHPLPRSTPPCGDGGTRNQRLPHASGVEEQVSATAQNHALSALLSLHRHLLARNRRPWRGHSRDEAERPPVVMTRKEAKVVLGMQYAQHGRTCEMETTST